MASLAQIKAAIAQTLSQYGSLNEAWIYDNLEESISTPAIIIDVDPETSADFEESFGASQDIWKLDIYILVSRSRGSGDGVHELDEYLRRTGPKSIRKAIYDKSDLGIEETEATVYGVSGYGGRFEIGKIDHVGAKLKVRVHTDGRDE